MDPVAHTLVGATLAETGLKKLSRYATATLIIGANLPDIDGIVQLWGRDASLYFRRGWSHGVLAMLVLPLLLAGAVWLWHRWRGGRRVDAPPFRPGMIVLLAFLATWTHPALDWLNTYGVRLLMPFSDTWFYGDTLFIIDPWFWLLTAAGVVMAHSSSRRAIAGWVLLAAVASLLVVATPLAPLAVKLVWLAGVAGLVLLRWRHRASAQTAARVGLATLLLYIGSMYGLARLAEANFDSTSPAPYQVQANPLPGRPFSKRMVLVYDAHYRVIAADGQVKDVPKQAPDEIVLAALKDESIRGFVNWMRFPYWEVTETARGWKVEFRDLRYVDPGAEPPGIGSATVKVLRHQVSH